MKRSLLSFALLIAFGPSAFAQWQTPANSVPVGRGPGVIGFLNAAPGTAGLPLTSNGASSPPSFQALSTGAFGVQSANTFLAGPLTGVAANPTFRACALVDGCLGGSQAAATVGQVPVFPGTGGAAVPTTITPAIISSLFANPTGTIGLTVSNGSATTAMRSDGAPPLSQAIAPTWTGLHIFNNGVQIGNPLLSGTFVGSGGAALFALNQSGAAASATSPEIGAQFTLTSNVGTANKTTAYKIGLTSSVIGAANSADIYGANIITQGFAGAGGYLVTGFESDINNVGADANTIGGTTAAYGNVSVAAGTKVSTAGYWATAAGSGQWTYGFACGDTAIGSNANCFYSSGSSLIGLYLTGTYTTAAIDISGATTTGGKQINGTGFNISPTGSTTALNFIPSGSGAITGPSMFLSGTTLTFSGGTTGYAWDNQLIGVQLMTLSNTGSLALSTYGAGLLTTNGSGVVSAISPTLNAIIKGQGAAAPVASGCLIADTTNNLTCSSTSAYSPQITVSNTAADANSPYIIFAKQRNGAAVQAGDGIGTFMGQAYANGSLQNAASFTFQVAGAPSGSNVPTAIIFTTSDTSGLNNHPFYFSASGGFSVGTTTDPGVGAILATTSIKATTTLTVAGMGNTATTSAVCYNTGTGLLTYDGTIGTCTVSDERLKNMGPRIDHALDKLLQINGVYYEWKDPSLGTGRQIGVGAQTVERVFPELVQTDSEGRKSADYQRLTAPIIEALRELKTDNDNLHHEFEQIKRRVSR